MTNKWPKLQNRRTQIGGEQNTDRMKTKNGQ